MKSTARSLFFGTAMHGNMSASALSIPTRINPFLIRFYFRPIKMTKILETEQKCVEKPDPDFENNDCYFYLQVSFPKKKKTDTLALFFACLASQKSGQFDGDGNQRGKMAFILQKN